MYKINQECETETIKHKVKLTQPQFVDRFNKKELKMISAPDIYGVLKRKETKLIESFKEDLKYYLWTSTRIFYNKDNLLAKIVHDFGSIVVTPKVYENIEIPDYSGDFKKDSTTEKYLQALFDTSDKLEEIITILNSIDLNKTLKLWTPNQESRNNKPDRAVRLCFNVFDFNVSGDFWVGNYCGFSRGVRVSSAKQNEVKKC